MLAQPALGRWRNIFVLYDSYSGLQECMQVLKLRAVMHLKKHQKCAYLHSHNPPTICIRGRPRANHGKCILY